MSEALISGSFLKVAANPTRPTEAKQPQARGHTRRHPRPPHGLSGGRRRLTDDGQGACRGTLRADAVDRGGGVPKPVRVLVVAPVPAGLNWLRWGIRIRPNYGVPYLFSRHA